MPNKKCAKFLSQCSTIFSGKCSFLFICCFKTSCYNYRTSVWLNKMEQQRLQQQHHQQSVVKLLFIWTIFPILRLVFFIMSKLWWNILKLKTRQRQRFTNKKRLRAFLLWCKECAEVQKSGWSAYMSVAANNTEKEWNAKERETFKFVLSNSVVDVFFFFFSFYFATFILNVGLGARTHATHILLNEEQHKRYIFVP